MRVQAFTIVKVLKYSRQNEKKLFYGPGDDVDLWHPDVIG